MHDLIISGSIFTFTTGDAQHYVLKRRYTGPFPEGSESAVFATGCFWGSEKACWRMPGVLTTAVGYVGGHTPNPTYEEVCSGRTGHTEAVLCVWDPSKVAFADLLKQFFEPVLPQLYWPVFFCARAVRSI